MPTNKYNNAYTAWAVDNTVNTKINSIYGTTKATPISEAPKGSLE